MLEIAGLKDLNICTLQNKSKETVCQYQFEIFLLDGECLPLARTALLATPSSGALSRRAPQRPGLVFIVNVDGKGGL